MQLCLQCTKTCLIALFAIGLSSCAAKREIRSTPELELANSEVATQGATTSATQRDTTQTTTLTISSTTSSATTSTLSLADGKQAPVTASDESSNSTGANSISSAHGSTQRPAYLRKNTDSNSTKAITQVSQKGTLKHKLLSEVSGMSASLKTPGVLFAINDSGNSATVFAFSEQGVHLGEWPIDAKNRDWEDMSSLSLDGQAYLLIGETGDNLKLHRNSFFYLVEEPTPGASKEVTPLPAIKLTFKFEDGPRNVEAFAVAGNSILLISKEPVTSNGPTASHLYEITIPIQFDNKQLIAKRVAKLPLARANFESKLAAAMAGVDLNHITSMDIDAASNTAYLLTYRHVIRIKRQDNQTWPEAFSKRGKRIYSHTLEQAEALAVAPNRAVWITSEKRPAPLWAIPITPPL